MAGWSSTASARLAPGIALAGDDQVGGEHHDPLHRQRAAAAYPVLGGDVEKPGEARIWSASVPAPEV
jgi:hypothetical protein